MCSNIKAAIGAITDGTENGERSYKVSIMETNTKTQWVPLAAIMCSVRATM